MHFCCEISLVAIRGHTVPQCMDAAMFWEHRNLVHILLCVSCGEASVGLPRWLWCFPVEGAWSWRHWRHCFQESRMVTQVSCNVKWKSCYKDICCPFRMGFVHIYGGLWNMLDWPWSQQQNTASAVWMYEIDDIAPLTLALALHAPAEKKAAAWVDSPSRQRDAQREGEGLNVTTSCTVGKVDNTAALSHIT